MANPYQAPQTRDTLATPDRPGASPPNIDNRGTWLGHPLGLYVLFVVEMWERFSYYGMRALLVLYLVAVMNPVADADGFSNPGRGWDKASASTLYGWYTGLAYLLPIFGGLIADKLIGTHRSMVLGGILIALGHIALAISGLGTMGHDEWGMTVFIFGLALIVIGTGHFKPCVSVMVGQLYPEGDPRRDGAFTIFYMGINLGAFLCAFVCGTLGEKVGWHWGFGSAAVGMIAGLLTYFAFRPKYLGDIGLPPPGRSVTQASLWLPVAFGLSACVAALYHYGAFSRASAVLGKFANDYPVVAGSVSAGMLLALVVLSAIFTMQQRPEDRGPVASIFIFMVLNVFFWLAFEQAGSSLNLFADTKTDRYIWMIDFKNFNFFRFEIPTTWFQSVNPLCIILFGPIMAMIWTRLGQKRRNPSQAVKISLGLLFLGLGYVVIVAGTQNAVGAAAKVSWFWLVAMYVIHTIGELCISPTGLSYVTKKAPVRFLSLLMGIWFISSFVANLVGGLIAAKVEAIEKGEIQLPWNLGGQADFFMLFVVSSLGVGALTLLASPLLNKIAGKEE